jgi:hypothetical protein
MGTQIVDFYGELTGKRIKGNFSPTMTKRLFSCLSMVLNSKKPLMVYNANSTEQSINNLQTHSLYFPFSEDGEVINKIIIYTEITKILEETS